MEVPNVRGIILCDQLIVEDKTRNVSLINAFTTRLVDEDPPPPQKFVLFAVLVYGRGIIPLDIVVTNLRTDDEVERLPIEFPFADVVSEHRLIYRFSHFVFPEIGSNEIALMAGLDLLASTRTLLKHREGL